MSILSFSNMEAATLKDLLVHEVKDLYDAELQLTEALPKMAEAASHSELRQALEQHLTETEQHIVRLEDVFAALEMKPERQTCDGMKGLITEGDHVLKGNLKGSVKDAALIAAASRVEHYEMAGYISAKTLARLLGLDIAAKLLQDTLKEEENADKLLMQISESVHEKAPAGMSR